MANADDLHYQRTEAAIREAFLGLLAETPLEKVSVRRLCDEAHINRNAFYLHYESGSFHADNQERSYLFRES